MSHAVVSSGAEAARQQDKLCRICQGINIIVLTSSTGYRHHTSYEGLKDSARQCPLCNIFVASWRQNKNINADTQQLFMGKQIYVGACEGSYVGLEINTGLTHLDILVEHQRLARLQLYAAPST